MAEQWKDKRNYRQKDNRKEGVSINKKGKQKNRDAGRRVSRADRQGRVDRQGHADSRTGKHLRVQIQRWIGRQECR